MGSDTLKTANDAASGDIDAAKYLVMGFSVLALVGGTVIGMFYTLGRGVGESARNTLADATESVSETAENAGGAWGDN